MVPFWAQMRSVCGARSGLAADLVWMAWKDAAPWYHECVWGACHAMGRVMSWSVSRGGVFHDARDLACPGVRTARQAETASDSQPAMKQLPPMGVRMPSGRVPVSTSR